LPLFACATFASYLFSGTTQFQRVSAPLWQFSDPLFLQLLSIFLFGACFGIYSRKIYLNYLTLTAVFALYFISSYHSKILSTVGITLTLIVPFALGQLKFKKFEGGRFFVWDVSYGFYLYSFPLQQMTVLLLPQMSFSGLFIVGLIVTLFFSILSYRMVEAPGINLGKTFKA
jgi:peptidoglycan/LPS O-acetylase OafA/YrhL